MVSPARRPSQQTSAWRSLADDELLQFPLRRLGLRPEDSPAQAHIDRLGAELKGAGLSLRPHCWFSVDWFSPDGVPGIALPFFLGDPRLMRLERRQMTWAEGASAKECLALLRHEAGHALDTAFGLSTKPLFRATFGLRSAPYRRHYSVSPHSRAFVRHLDRWYAQSHPAEDFAESFAIWLASRGRWRKRYADTPALEKLRAVDDLMASIRGRRPKVTRRERVESLGSQTITLAEHYRRRRRRVEREAAAPFEQSLRRAFPPGRPWNSRAPAALLLARERKDLVARSARELGVDPYGPDQVLGLMIQRARELGLGLERNSASTPRAYDPVLCLRMIRTTLRALERGTYRLSR